LSGPNVLSGRRSELPHLNEGRKIALPLRHWVYAMNKQILAKVAAWWTEMPEDALDDPIESYAKLDILASAVPELLVENVELRPSSNEFMRQEGQPGNSAELFVRVRQALGTLPS
jgi:hypothetical protein